MKDKLIFFALMLTFLLSFTGCGSGGLAALQIIQTGAVGAMAYDTLTKEDRAVQALECADMEYINLDSDFSLRLTRGEKIQIANHNDKVDRCQEGH